MQAGVFEQKVGGLDAYVVSDNIRKIRARKPPYPLWCPHYFAAWIRYPK